MRQHAEEDMRFDAVLEPVADGSDLEVDRFERAEGTLDLTEHLVATHHIVRGQPLCGHAGPDDIDSINASLLVGIALIEVEVESIIASGACGHAIWPAPRFGTPPSARRESPDGSARTGCADRTGRTGCDHRRRACEWRRS